MYTVSCPKCHRETLVLSRRCKWCNSKILGRQRFTPSYQSRVFLCALPIAALLSFLIYSTQPSQKNATNAQRTQFVTPRMGGTQLFQLPTAARISDSTSKPGGRAGETAAGQSTPPTSLERLTQASSNIHARCQSVFLELSKGPQATISAFESSQIVEVFHIREARNSSSFYGCKFADNRILWRGKMEESWSRWWTHKFASNISYKIEDNELHVSGKSANGSGQTIVFGKKDF